MTAVLGTIIDSEALLDTTVAALAAGVGVAFTFSLAILGFARLAEASRDGQRFESVLYATLALLGLVASLVAIAFGIVVMTSS